MKIAIVLLNYNSAADCQKCIPGLLKQRGVETEIIVVDNSSGLDDRIQTEQLCLDFGCVFLTSQSNRGYNAGNNIGLRYASAKGYFFALVCNPDMEFPQQDYLEKLLAPMLAEEKIVACGSDVVTPDGIHQNPKSYPPSHWYHSFNWTKGIFRKNAANPIPNWINDPHVSGECNGLNGCSLLLRISFLRQIDFFDERTFLYGEEPILARQVERAGYKMFYNAEAFSIHDHKGNKKGNIFKRLCYWKSSQLLYISDYSGYPYYGKITALISLHLYFSLLKISYWIKSLRGNIN